MKPEKLWRYICRGRGPRWQPGSGPFFAGDPKEAVLLAGAGVCATLYGVHISEKFDIVIASCGGHPKDITLYQAQKGLNLASHALKPGGQVLLLAACPQGVGDDVYFDYVSRFQTTQEVLDDFRRLGFKMGAHKAFLFARTSRQLRCSSCFRSGCRDIGEMPPEGG